MKIDDLINDRKIIIFGENHSKPDDVDRIRESIIKLDPDVILHELYWEDEEFYNNNLEDATVLPLENDVDINSDDLKSQFMKREQSMIENLNDVLKNDNYDVIVVVVGDTHLRTIKTNELGNKSPLVEWAKDNNATIVRSPYNEIARGQQ